MKLRPLAAAEVNREVRSALEIVVDFLTKCDFELDFGDEVLKSGVSFADIQTVMPECPLYPQ